MEVDGVKYSGPARDGLPHGKGEWVDRWRVFKGTWLYGKREGPHLGKSEDGEVYEWNYKDGEVHGYQKITYSDGRVCEWNMKEGEPHGYQKTTYGDGTVCEENYKDGEPHGWQKTSFLDRNVEIRYFENGKLTL